MNIIQSDYPGFGTRSFTELKSCFPTGICCILFRSGNTADPTQSKDRKIPLFHGEVQLKREVLVVW